MSAYENQSYPAEVPLTPSAGKHNSLASQMVEISGPLLTSATDKDLPRKYHSDRKMPKEYTDRLYALGYASALPILMDMLNKNLQEFETICKQHKSADDMFLEMHTYSNIMVPVQKLLSDRFSPEFTSKGSSKLALSETQMQMFNQSLQCLEELRPVLKQIETESDAFDTLSRNIWRMKNKPSSEDPFNPAFECAFIQSMQHLNALAGEYESQYAEIHKRFNGNTDPINQLKQEWLQERKNRHLPEIQDNLRHILHL